MFNIYGNALGENLPLPSIDLTKYINYDKFNPREIEEILKVIKIELERKQNDLLDVIKQFNPQTATWACIYWKNAFGINEYTDEEFQGFLLEKKRYILKLFEGLNTTFNEENIKKVISYFYDEDIEIIKKPGDILVIKFLGTKGVPRYYNILLSIFNKRKPIHIQKILFEFSYTIWEELQSNNWSDVSNTTWNDIRTLDVSTLTTNES